MIVRGENRYQIFFLIESFGNIYSWMAITWILPSDDGDTFSGIQITPIYLAFRVSVQ